MLAEVKQTVAASRTEIERFTLVMTAYTYRTLPDNHYDAYLSFLESSASERLNEVAVSAINDNLSRTFSILGWHIQDRLTGMQSQTLASEQTTL